MNDFLPKELNCYVVDDEVHQVKNICNYINQLSGLVLAGSNTNPVLAVEEIRTGNVDIVFTDINMEGISGFELAQLIPSSIDVVLSTAYDQSEFPDFDWNNYLYLQKPVFLKDFEKIISGIKRRFWDGTGSL
jgi:two-component system LytT family response regulator